MVLVWGVPLEEVWLNPSRAVVNSGSRPCYVPMILDRIECAADGLLKV